MGGNTFKCFSFWTLINVTAYLISKASMILETTEQNLSESLESFLH